jgi:hypothetical protein
LLIIFKDPQIYSLSSERGTDKLTFYSDFIN